MNNRAGEFRINLTGELRYQGNYVPAHTSTHLDVKRYYL